MTNHFKYWRQIAQFKERLSRFRGHGFKSWSGLSLVLYSSRLKVKVIAIQNSAHSFKLTYY